jgi:hypothetical protein
MKQSDLGKSLDPTVQVARSTLLNTKHAKKGSSNTPKQYPRMVLDDFKKYLYPYLSVLDSQGYPYDEEVINWL